MSLDKEFIRDGKRRIIGSVTTGYVGSFETIVRDEQNNITGSTSDPQYSSSFWQRILSRASVCPHKGLVESEANRTSLPNSSMNSSHAFQSHTRQ
jgi:hypothetical protein